MMKTQLKAATKSVKFSFNRLRKSIIVFCDVSVDTDDAIALGVLAAKQGYNLIIVCNGSDPDKKARYAQGLMNSFAIRGLDISHITVLAGSDCNVTEHSLPHQFNNLAFQMADVPTLSWEETIHEVLLNSQPKSVSILGIGPMTDLCNTLFQFSSLVKVVVEQVVLMCDVANIESSLVKDWGIPMFDNANNGTFDPKATAAMYGDLFSSRYYCRTTIVSKWAAGACKVGYDYYSKLGELSNQSPLAVTLADKQQAGLKHLFYRASSTDQAIRGSLPPSFTTGLFNKIFCGGKLPEYILQNPDSDPIGWLIENDLVDVVRFQLYDAIAALALLSWLEDRNLYGKMFTPIEANDSLHVIGFNAQETGVLSSSLIIDKIKEYALNSMNGVNIM